MLYLSPSVVTASLMLYLSVSSASGMVALKGGMVRSRNEQTREDLFLEILQLLTVNAGIGRAKWLRATCKTRNGEICCGRRGKRAERSISQDISALVRQQM